jgi:hypothetical protein
MDVAPEQIEHGKIRGGFAIGHRGTFEDPPSREVVGMDELIHQAGLPHPGLSNHGDDVAVARGGPGQCLLECFEFHLAPDEAREPTRRGSLEAPPDHTGPDQFEDVHRLGSPLTGTGPKAWTRTAPSTSCRVAAVTRIVPGGANCSIRAARFVVRPTPE